MNAVGKDYTDFREPDIDTEDIRFKTQCMEFLIGYGDEERFGFWKTRNVNFNKVNSAIGR